MEENSTHLYLIGPPLAAAFLCMLLAINNEQFDSAHSYTVLFIWMGTATIDLKHMNLFVLKHSSVTRCLFWDITLLENESYFKSQVPLCIATRFSPSIL